MKSSKILLLVSWGANHGAAFAPSMLISRRDLIKTYLSTTTTAGASEEVKHCIPLQDICLDDLPKVGGKTASLGEMIQQLTPLGVSVPGGFGVSSSVYDGKMCMSLLFWCSILYATTLTDSFTTCQPFLIGFSYENGWSCSCEMWT